MLTKTLALPLSIAAGLAFGTSAFAQTSVGTATVSDEDLPLVTQYCEALSAGDTTGVESDTLPSGLVLSDITIADCEAAGLVTDGDDDDDVADPTESPAG